MCRIMLDEDQFVQLIHGRVVEADGVEIALSDIGHSQMQRWIHLSQLAKQDGNWECQRCHLPVDNLRGMWAVPGVGTVCRKCIRPGESDVSPMARGI